MNSIMERWVQTCRLELLDRTLIWNHEHLLHALREFESLQRAPAPPNPAQRSTPPPATSPDHRSHPDRSPRNPPTRPTRRDPPPIHTCRLTCTDEVIGTRRPPRRPPGPGRLCHASRVTEEGLTRGAPPVPRWSPAPAGRPGYARPPPGMPVSKTAHRPAHPAAAAGGNARNSCDPPLSQRRTPQLGAVS
jgi:hypothetical protein